MKTLKFLILILIVFTLSCSHSDDDGGAPFTKDDKLLQNLVFDNGVPVQKRRFAFSYDSQNKLDKVMIDDFTNPATEFLKYTYDGDRIVKITGAASTFDFEYDSQGRLSAYKVGAITINSVYNSSENSYTFINPGEPDNYGKAYLKSNGDLYKVERYDNTTSTIYTDYELIIDSSKKGAMFNSNSLALPTIITLLNTFEYAHAFCTTVNKLPGEFLTLSNTPMFTNNEFDSEGYIIKSIIGMAGSPLPNHHSDNDNEFSSDGISGYSLTYSYE